MQIADRRNTRPWLSHEHLLTFTDAVRHLPAANGRRCAPSTIYRWCRRGIGGIRLEYIRVGRAMLTSQEALQRFFDALAAADDVRGSTPTDSREGVNVSIVAFIGTQDASNKARKPVGRYLAKDSLMPMDLSAVAFAMCEIVFFRIICAIGQGRHLPGTFDRSYGSPMSLPEADRQGVDFLVEKDVLSEEAAARWLKTCLTESEVALV